MSKVIHPNTRIAIYSRKSRGEDEKVLSKHRARLNEFVVKNNLNNVTWYEEVATGTSIDERHEFSKLLKDVENYKYDIILTIDMDRITRGDTYERGLIERTLKNSNTLIYTLDGELIDYNDINQSLSANVKGLLANYEATQIIKRMINGKKDAVKRGRTHSGSAPYGYKWDRNTRSVYVDKDEAKAYRMMIEWYINEGMSFRSIANKLNSLNIKTSRGGIWHPERISKTLQNEFHLGYVFYGEYKTEKTGRFNDKGKMIMRISKNEDVNSIIKEKGNHEALKTPEEHAKIMKIIMEHKRFGLKQSEINDKAFKLKSLIRCPYCKLTTGIIYREDRVTQVRKCTRKSKHRTKECDNTRGITEDVLYKIVINELRKYRDELFSQNDYDEDNQICVLDMEIENIEKSISINLKSIEKEKEMFRADVIDIDTLKSNIQKIEDNNKNLEDELMKLKMNKSYLDKEENEERIKLWNSDNIIELLENPNVKFDDKTINNLLKLVIHSISYIITNDNIEISIIYK